MIFRRALRALSVVVTVSVLTTLSACKNAGEQKHSASAVDAAARWGAVFIDVDARRVTFRVELARTPAEHERGLMFRTQLDRDAGMLFLFDRPAQQTFWMKNTLIPLDMIFISADHEIVGVVARAEPQTLTARQVAGPSQYVLEIGGGIAAEKGIRAGQHVEFRGTDGP